MDRVNWERRVFPNLQRNWVAINGTQSPPQGHNEALVTGTGDSAVDRGQLGLTGPQRGREDRREK